MATSLTDPNVVLHLGAHKTASTHLQQSLREVNGKLIRAGVRFYGPESLRKLGYTLAERFGFPFDPARARDDIDPLAELSRMADGAGRVVFSEENFAGKFQRGWGKVPLPLYPDAPERVSKLAQVLARPVDVCLAIRQPSDFLSSIYSQVLLSGKDVTPDEFLQRNAPSEVDWASYVGDLRKASGIGKLTVWRFEDYGTIFDRIIAAMVGDEAARLVAPVPDRAMPRLSAAAVGTVMSQRLLRDDREDVRDIAARLPATADNPPFELYEDELRAVAQDYYDAQVAAIAQTPGVTLLRA